MKKGFTLIELIGVICILAIISLLVAPIITEQISSARDKLDKATLDLIYTGADLYVEAHKNYFPKQNGQSYCVTLQTIVDDGKLKSPITDVQTGEEISLEKKIRVTVRNNNYLYELLDANLC